MVITNKEKAACSTVGIASLKAKQREAITRFVGGEDVFICLPTGFGKSLCYALLPLVFDYPISSLPLEGLGTRLT